MKASTNLQLSGIAVSPGLASGRAFLFQDIFEREIKGCAIERNQVEDELVCSEQAVQRVFRRWERKFRASSHDILRKRVADLADLGRRLLRSLAGLEAHSLEKMPEGFVLVARRLLPSETVFLSRRTAAGVVVQTGGRGSHCAVLTRAMGIPAVVLDNDIFQIIAPGDDVLVDGLNGRVIIRPDTPTSNSFQARVQRHTSVITEASARASEPAVTLDGVNIPVMANVGCLDDVERAIENGADGVGLYRIETFYLGRSSLPGEDELTEELKTVVQPFQGKPVCIRLLDIGGDKPLSYLPLHCFRSSRSRSGIPPASENHSTQGAKTMVRKTVSRPALFLQNGRVVELGTGYVNHLREEMCRALRCDSVESGADDPPRTGDDP